MKKPLFTTLGLASACAACCAVPLLVPVLSGLSAAGLVGVDWTQLAISHGYVAIVSGVVVAFAVTFGLWLIRRKRATNVCSNAVVPHSGEVQTALSCGCSGPSNSASCGRQL